MNYISGSELLSAVIYSGLGVGFFGLVFLMVVRFAPFPVIKEIEEDQNTALAILIGSVFIGVAIIVAAAITG